MCTKKKKGFIIKSKLDYLGFEIIRKTFEKLRVSLMVGKGCVLRNKD